MDNKWEMIETVLDDFNLRYDISDNTYAIVEFWTDTAGQDIVVELSYNGTPDDFILEFSDHADSYDVDEEVELYVSMRGKNGVPETVRELLDDCQEAKDTLMNISDRLKKIA